MNEVNEGGTLWSDRKMRRLIDCITSKNASKKSACTHDSTIDDRWYPTRAVQLWDKINPCFVPLCLCPCFSILWLDPRWSCATKWSCSEPGPPIFHPKFSHILVAVKYLHCSLHARPSAKIGESQQRARRWNRGMIPTGTFNLCICSWSDRSPGGGGWSASRWRGCLFLTQKIWCEYYINLKSRQSK